MQFLCMWWESTVLSLTGFAHIFIKLRLLYLKSLEKNSFLARGQATGQGSILVYKNSQRFAVKYSVRTIVQHTKTQTSLLATLRHLGDMLERWSNDVIFLASSHTGFLIARIKEWIHIAPNGIAQGKSTTPLSGSRTPKTMTARWQSIMCGAEKLFYVYVNITRVEVKITIARVIFLMHDFSA